MKTTRHIAALAALIMLLPGLTSCSSYDWLGLVKGQSPTVNTRFESSRTQGIDKPVKQLEASSDNYGIYFITDIHATDETENLEDFVQTCLKDTVAESFAICLGDMVNGKGYFPHVHDVLTPLSSGERLLFCTPGNHDLYFGEWENYAKYWPSSSYWFTVETPSAGTDLFICLDSAEGTLGTSQREWLGKLLEDSKDKGYRHTTVFTHTHFFKRDISQGTTGNFNIEETSDLLSLFAAGGVDYVFGGHDHWFELSEFRGVSYYTLSAFTELELEHYWYIFSFGDTLTYKEFSSQ